MQITYCDSCGCKLTSDNKAGRQNSYNAAVVQEHPTLMGKTINVEVNLTYGSDVGMSRVTQNNGDFCNTCLEGIVIQSMLQRQAAAEANQETEDEDEETNEGSSEVNDGSEAGPDDDGLSLGKDSEPNADSEADEEGLEGEDDQDEGED